MIDSQIYYLPYTNCIFALHYLLCLLYHELLYPEQGTIAELYVRSGYEFEFSQGHIPKINQW